MAHAGHKPKTAKTAVKAAAEVNHVPTKAKGILKVARESRWDLVEQALLKGVAMQEREEDKLIKVALGEADWAQLTMRLFKHDVGLWGPHARSALRRAVELRNWQYLVQAEEMMDMSSGEPDVLLDILRIKPVLLDRMERTCAIHDVLDDVRWQQAMFEIVLDSITTWCQLSKSTRKWNVLLETMVDFQHKSDKVQYCLENTILVLEDQDVSEVHRLSQVALDQGMYFIVKYMVTYQYITKEQAGQAAWMAYGEKDWDTFVNCVYAGANVYQFYHDASALHIALRQNFFQLTRILPLDPDMIDLEDCARMTFLHTALNCWRDNFSSTVIMNIKILLENGADITVDDPEGVTVMHKLADKSQDQDPQENRYRSRLIAEAVESAVRLGRTITWAPVAGSGGGWSALHCLCAEGAAEHVPRLLELGADPFQRRRGLTLVDTALLAEGVAVGAKREVLLALLQVPELAEDHAHVVQHRPAPAPSAPPGAGHAPYPLLHLLRLAQTDESHFELIRILHSRRAFSRVEQSEALQESSLSDLRAHGLHQVIAYLQEEMAQSDVVTQLEELDLKAD